MIAIVIQSILRVVNDDNKDYDFDWACNLVDAPIIALILIILVGANGINIVVSTGLAKTMGVSLNSSTYVKSVQEVETMAYCNEVLTEKTGCLTLNHFVVI